MRIPSVLLKQMSKIIKGGLLKTIYEKVFRQRLVDRALWQSYQRKYELKSMKFIKVYRSLCLLTRVSKTVRKEYKL